MAEPTKKELLEQFQEILEDYREPSEEKPIDDVIVANEEHLKEVFGEVPESLWFELERYLFDELSSPTQQSMGRYLKLLRLHTLIALDRLHQDFKKGYDKGFQIYRLGLLRERLRSIEDEIEALELRIDGFARIRSRMGQKGRWGEQSIRYDEAVAIAERLWADGDELPCSRMVEYLLGLPDFSYLDERHLRRKLAPIAEKHNRLLPRGRPKKHA